MGIAASRPHVFCLTPDQVAALELWEEYRWMGVYRFSAAIRVNHTWMYRAISLQREIAAFDTPPTPQPSSLSRARGKVRMDGTR